MSEAVTPAAGVFAVDAGDDVRVATSMNEWKTPLSVVDVETTEWDVPFGENWVTREVTVEGGLGAAYLVRCAEETPSLQLWRVDGGDRGTLERFDPVDEDDTDEADIVCDDCGQSFETEQQLSGHRNTPQTDCGSADQDDSATNDRPQWLARDADEIVDASALDVGLGELLDEVSRQETVIDVYQRFGDRAPLSRLKSVCWELGLTQPHSNQFVDDLAARADALQEAYNV